MNQETTASALHIPARDIPVPAHLSPEAQAWLAMPRASGGAGYPALDDVLGWRQHIAAMDAMIMQMYMHRPPAVPCTISELTEGDARGYEIIPEGVSADDRRVYLDIHGGALIMGSGEVCKAMATGSACRLGVQGRGG